MKITRNSSNEILVKLHQEELSLFSRVFHNQEKGVELVMKDRIKDSAAIELEPVYHELVGISSQFRNAVNFPHLIKNEHE